MIYKKITLLLTLIFSFCLLSSPVSAYLDPGTGSMVWQMMVAIIFGIAFTLKIYWIKIKNFFRRKKEKNVNEY
jgi:hypothetical protein